MKTRLRRKSEYKRMTELVAASVEYVNLKKIQFRSEQGEKFTLSTRYCPALLPGDLVRGKLGQFKGQRTLKPSTLSIERRKDCQVVLRVKEPSRSFRSTPELEPVGMMLPGMIEFSDKLSDIEQVNYLLATLTLKPGRSRDGIFWQIKAIDRILTSDHEVAAAVALCRYGLRNSWPESVLAEVNAGHYALNDIGRRKDLRNLAFVTIDPAGAMDHDDAVFCERWGADGFRLRVAIADVSHYVKPQSKLDTAALMRGTSIYFSRSSVPMLPHRLSNDICSLLPNVDRFALVCEMCILADGTISSYQFYEAVIQSQARLTYENVEHNRQNHAWNKDVISNVRYLFELHDAFLIARNSRKALNFAVPAIRFKFDSSGFINSVYEAPKYSSHSLIEEAMLAANTSAAKFIAKYYSDAGLYRIHDVPPQESLDLMNQILNDIGIRHQLTPGSLLSDYQRICEALKARDSSLSSVMQIHLLRSLQLAIYSSKKGSHFALNYPEYTHFTSPIRRYPDLVVHRLIKAGLYDMKDSPQTSDLTVAARESSNSERRADNCARDAEGWLKAQYMKAHIGKNFDGVVIDVKNFGIFVQLESPLIDGMVHVSELGSEYFEYEESSRILVGSDSGMSYSIGDQLRIQVVSADPELGEVGFALA